MASSTTAEQLCRQFTLAEIQSATGDFSEEHLIGKGGFGKVYKGFIDDGSISVAIKRLASNSNQGETEFATEMETLTQLRHRNLVSLIGYCKELEEMILVYEFMPNGTLADHLHKLAGDSPSLTWNQRLTICIGAGRGLDYLHTGSSIIHRDVKSTNILLDEHFVAKVSDFGLAKHLGANHLVSHVSASLKGTFGYIDPSYFNTGKLTRASDTYAFGVMLLEVLTGRRAVDPKLGEREICLTWWAKEKIENGKADQIVAFNLRGEISEDCFKTFIKVAKRCLDHEPKKRLTMSRVVAQLELAFEQQERKGPTRKLQFWPFRNRVPPSGSTQNIISAMPIYVPNISLAEMKDITDNLSTSKRLIYAERVDRGILYRVVLKSGHEAVVKKIYMPSEEKITKEVSIVSSLKHEHVAQLLGYYVDGNSHFFAYEFAPRGTLHDILHGINGAELGSTLSWTQRIEIVVGIAKGLHYIHEKSLIHGNIRSSNVLIFRDEISKISDFQFSIACGCFVGKQFHDDRHPYAPPLRWLHHPPECEWRGQSKKGDVYGFGVILLELLTGQKLYDINRLSLSKHYGSNLVSWAEPRLREDKVETIVDARLIGHYPLKEVAKMAEVAQLCVDYDYDRRPDMGTVLRQLQNVSQES